MAQIKNPLEEIPNPLNPKVSPGIRDFINFLSNFILKIGPVLLAIAMIVGGYFILTSSGDEKKLKTGKKIIIISLICLIFVFLINEIKEAILKFLLEISQ